MILLCQYYFYRLFSIIFLLFFLLTYADGKCDKIKAKISQRLLKQGFHREIQYIVNLIEESGHDIWSSGACRLSVKQVLPPGAYVSPDELYELKRHKKLLASALGDVDVEKPKHMSRKIVVQMYATVDSPNLKFNIPIHLRYHRAKSKGGFENIRIRRPWILLRCPNNIFKMCTPAETIIAPCAEFSPHECSWHNLTTSSLTPLLETAVPIGNLDDAEFVSFITLFVSFAGCLLIILAQNKIDCDNRSQPK